MVIGAHAVQSYSRLTGYSPGAVARALVDRGHAVVGTDALDLVSTLAPAALSATGEIVQHAVDAKQAAGKKPDAAKDAKQSVPSEKPKGSWWTRPVLGPIPGVGVAVGGAGLLALVIGLLVKAARR